MNIFKVTALTVVFAAPLASCSSTPLPEAPKMSSSAASQEGVPGGVFVNTLDVSARVTAIDLATRKVTLVNSEGRTFTVKAGPEVINLDQIKAGDTVKLTVTEELVVYLADESAPPDATAGIVALAPKGARPGGVVAATERVTGTVTAIDLAKHTATIRFEDGTTKTFPVRPDVDLSQHQAGERVVFHSTEMIALRVEKP